MQGFFHPFKNIFLNYTAFLIDINLVFEECHLDRKRTFSTGLTFPSPRPTGQNPEAQMKSLNLFGLSR